MQDLAAARQRDLPKRWPSKLRPLGPQLAAIVAARVDEAQEVAGLGHVVEHLLELELVLEKLRRDQEGAGNDGP